MNVSLPVLVRLGLLMRVGTRRIDTFESERGLRALLLSPTGGCLAEAYE